MTARAPRALAAALAFALGAAPLAQAGDPARDGLRRLERLEQRIELDDLRRRAPRTRGEERRRDLAIDREREAIEHGVTVRERMERAGERLGAPAPAPAPGLTPVPAAPAPFPAPAPAPAAGPAPGAGGSRAAFDAKADDLQREQELDRLRRDAVRLRSGPGARRWRR